MQDPMLQLLDHLYWQDWPKPEHRRVTGNGDNKNNIAEHHLPVKSDHRIDKDSAECISLSTDYHQQLDLGT